jgi:hypothetical protein
LINPKFHFAPSAAELAVSIPVCFPPGHFGAGGDMRDKISPPKPLLKKRISPAGWKTGPARPGGKFCGA